MNKMTWVVDTCGCKLEQEWDGVDYAATNRFTAVLSRCLRHQGIPDDQVYKLIRDNPDSDLKVKNGIYRFLLEAFPDKVLETTVDHELGTLKLDKYSGDYIGTGVYEGLKGSKEAKKGWEFSEDRKLIINLDEVNFTAKEIEEIKDFAKSEFGSDEKIVFN